MPKSLIRRFTKHIFIISNIVVAILFLVGCYGYWFNPTHFWFIGFLTLGTFYLFVVVALFILFWLFVKKKRAIISVVAILLSIPAFKNVISIRFTASFNKIKQDSSNTRVMSWNVQHFDILHHKTKPQVKLNMIDLVNDYSPDIACFQEMVGSDSSAKAINYVPEMQKQMNFSYQYYSYFKYDNFDEKHHFGNIIFSKFPIVNAKTVVNNPHDYNSNFEYVDIVKYADTIRVFNVHLESLRFSPDNLKYIENPDIKEDKNLVRTKSIFYKLKIGFIKRQSQANNIKKEIAQSPYPVIICGDFNDVPNSYAYHTIGENLQNCFEEKGTGFGKTYNGENHKSISPTLRIDNIFADKKYKIVQFITVKKDLSDHYPIVADLHLNSN